MNARCLAYGKVKKLKVASAKDPITPSGIRTSSRVVKARFMPQKLSAMLQAIILVIRSPVVALVAIQQALEVMLT